MILVEFMTSEFWARGLYGQQCAGLGIGRAQSSSRITNGVEEGGEKKTRRKSEG